MSRLFLNIYPKWDINVTKRYVTIYLRDVSQTSELSFITPGGETTRRMSTDACEFPDRSRSKEYLPQIIFMIFIGGCIFIALRIVQEVGT
eukprot:1121550-Amorphochlora_amoeboformis.AAC.2